MDNLNWQLCSDAINNRTWALLSARFDWVRDMHGVEQDNQHHAEGDVAIHTQNVLRELVALPEYQTLNTIEQEILWVAALLHDVEKRSTTRIDDNGRIISPGHAKKGESTARQILYQLNTPFVIREHIAALVRFHGLPLWIMEKPDPQKALLAASLRVDMRLLSLLAKADVLGRICQDSNELLERIDLFELYCQEQHCWDCAYPFNHHRARYHYFASSNQHPDFIPFNNSQSQVVLLTGLPGMGKDSFIAKGLKNDSVISDDVINVDLFNKDYQDWHVVSLDDIRRANKISPADRNATGWVVQQAKAQAKEFLRKGENFVWNATSLTTKIRGQLIDLFYRYNAEITIVYIEVPFAQWQSQNKQRQYVVPNNVMQRMLSILEVPTPDEAHHVIYHIEKQNKTLYPFCDFSAQ